MTFGKIAIVTEVEAMADNDASKDDRKRSPSRDPSRLILMALLVVAVGGGVYLYPRVQARIHRGEDGRLQGITIAARDTRIDAGGFGLSPAGPLPGAIRIATLNVGGLDETKLANLEVNKVLIPLLAKFDVMALQGIRARNRGVLLRLVEQINATGRKFRFVTERNTLNPPCAFLFDQATVEIDYSKVEPVEDPQGRFTHRPLVAWFRVRGLDPKEAFTFKLINVQIHANYSDTAFLETGRPPTGQTAVELDLLDDVYRAVRDDGSHEDDVILLGSFATDTDGMEQFKEVLDTIRAITEIPTTVDGGPPRDNILFDRVATCEYTGRAEVLDLMRGEFGLSRQSARQISPHLPVWAEFQSFEGGTSDRMAASN